MNAFQAEAFQVFAFQYNTEVVLPDTREVFEVADWPDEYFEAE